MHGTRLVSDCRMIVTLAEAPAVLALPRRGLLRVHTWLIWLWRLAARRRYCRYGVSPGAGNAHQNFKKVLVELILQGDIAIVDPDDLDRLHILVVEGTPFLRIF